MNQETSHLKMMEMSQNSGLTQEPMTSACSIFLGNLSILCNEMNLRELFSQFGPIATIRLKKSDVDPHRAHLSYGFVDFYYPESAQRALSMDNTLFLGRVLRVGLASDYVTRQNNRKMGFEGDKPKQSSQTAQVHVTFVAHSLEIVLSEVTLREIFTPFQNLVDVVIKKNVAHEKVGVQSGYGFIHFRFDEAGIQSALNAVEVMNHRNVGGVTYECSLTHSLKTHLFSLKNRRIPSRSFDVPARHHSYGPPSSTFPPRFTEEESMVSPVISNHRFSFPFNDHQRKSRNDLFSRFSNDNNFKSSSSSSERTDGTASFDVTLLRPNTVNQNQANVYPQFPKDYEYF